MTSRIRVEPPAQLPSNGLTTIKYKQWKVALKIFLQQTPEYREYFPGGLYPTWQPSEDFPNRIKSLHADDVLEKDITTKEQLAQRRIHLETFLGIIARYSDEGDFDDIMEKSTSLEWIHLIHERRYGIQRKGRYFHKLDSLRFDKATMTDYYKFYSDIRSCFKGNLMKAGEIVKYKQEAIKEDEKISPSTECLLIQIALERIDSRLPTEIDRIFGYRMEDGTTLMDLCSEIFAYVPRALASLEREENMSCSSCNVHQHNQSESGIPEYANESVDINAMTYNRTPRVQTRQQGRQSNRSGYQQRQQYTQKFCKICKALELPQSVVSSHNSSECKKKILLQEVFLEQPAVENQHEEYYTNYTNNYQED